MNGLSDEELSHIINETIPFTLPRWHRNAIVGSVDLNGVQVEARFVKDGNSMTWELRGMYEHTWSGNDRIKSKVIVSW